MIVAIRSDTPRLTATTFDQFWAKVVGQCQGADRIDLDLRGLQFIDMFAMTGLIYGCADILEHHDCAVHVVCDDDGACQFLPRAGFFDMLSPQVDISETFTSGRLQWESELRGNDPKLIELTPIVTEAAIDLILKHLIGVLRHRLKFTKNEAYDLANMFSELCNNVIDHNPNGADGLVAMHIYGRPPERFMRFVVADRGAGILETLRRNRQNRHVTNDIDAILSSVTLGTSEFSEDTHGNGLYHLVRLVRKFHGNLHIRSGRGKVYIRSDREEPYRFAVAPLSGCQFSIEIPARD